MGLKGRNVKPLGFLRNRGKSAPPLNLRNERMMTYKGLTVDYNEEKARIDASGFDAIRAMEGQNCDECGRTFDADEEILYIDGREICEKCQKES